MKKILLLALVLFGISALYAERFEVKGIVLDEKDNEPLIGVVIYEKNPSTGIVVLENGLNSSAITDLKGEFSLTVSEGNTLEVSYIGYEKQEVPVKKGEFLRIRLKENKVVLDEIIVTGYGSHSKATVSGAITTAPVSGLKLPSAAVTESLAGSLSGLSVIGIATDLKSGTLTAGEVNDFAKWFQWEKYLKNDFGGYMRSWRFAPYKRYTAQLTNTRGIPLVNADVKLVNDAGNILWQSKTDNTGKAELWNDFLLKEQEEETGENLHILITYNGQTIKLDDPVPFSQGINTAQIDVSCPAENKVDLFFIVDATGSMSDEIHYLQVELEDIVRRVSREQRQLELRTGSLVYRDHGDEYLTRKSSLNSEINETLNFLNAQQALGGGDTPEAVDEALVRSIENEAWNNDALARIAFLVLDAPAHRNPEVISRLAIQIKLASEKGIRVVPVICSGMSKEGEYLMRCLALGTNGTCIFLTDDSGIGNPHLKPTTDKLDVEKLNDAMVRVILQYTKMPDCEDNAAWAKANVKKSETDKFVPDPYDDEAEKDLSRMKVADLITVYPNPCRDVLKVKMKKKIQDMYFVDMTGKSLHHFNKEESDAAEFDVSHMSTGVYFLKVNYKGKWFAEKIIVTTK